MLSDALAIGLLSFVMLTLAVNLLNFLVCFIFAIRRGFIRLKNWIIIWTRKKSENSSEKIETVKIKPQLQEPSIN